MVGCRWLRERADLLRSFLIVFTLAQLLYQTFWKPSGLAPAIAARTSRGCCR